jgi:Rrf2 family protein
MEISRRTDYAIRLVAALVESDGKPLSVREAAARQSVPYAFARSIQHDLVRSGLVKSIRGAHGGMVLAGDPNALTLLELIETVQGPINVAVCTTEPDWCPREKGCEFHDVWEGADKLFKDYLSSVSIKELMGGSPACITKAHYSKN